MNWTKKTIIYWILIFFIAIIFIGFNYLSNVILKKRFAKAPPAEFVEFYDKYIRRPANPGDISPYTLKCRIDPINIKKNNI